jgi:hypothetical protein
MADCPELAKASELAMESVRAVATEEEEQETAMEVADWERSDRGQGSVVHHSSR